MNSALKHLLIIAVLAAIGLSFNRSADAQIDPTFGTNGSVFTDVQGNERFIESFVLPNDKILAVISSTLNSQTKYYLIRYNANGNLLFQGH